MLAVAGATAGAPPAVAQQRLPEDNAGTGQYVEPVPDAGGDRPSAPGGGRGGAGLSPRAREALPPGAEGRALERLATEPGLGAPTGNDGDASGSDGGGSENRVRTAPEEEESAANAVTSAVTGSDGAVVPLVALVALALTLVAGIAGLRTRRRGS